MPFNFAWLLVVVLASPVQASGRSISCWIDSKSEGKVELGRCVTVHDNGDLELQKKARGRIRFDKRGLAPLYIDRDCFWASRAGKVRQAFCFDNGPDDFSEGLARTVDRDGKIGFMNEKLEVVIPPQYKFAAPYRKGKVLETQGPSRE